MFFAKIGQNAPCGIFSTGHIILFLITAAIIVVGLIFTKNKEKTQVKIIIKTLIISIWILEIARISYKLYCGDLIFFESYVPLFFCSIFLYAGLFSVFGKNKLQRTGDVVLVTGSLVGGIVFTIYPATSLVDYPAFHFVSVHSFLYHGCMVYTGLLMLMSGYIKLKKNDILSYSAAVLVMVFVAFFVNSIADTNFMFISKAFPGPFGKIIYQKTGVMYTCLLVAAHIVLPFYTVYAFQRMFSCYKK